MKASNYDHYENRDFNSWAYRNELLASEQYLLETFLSKEQSTLEAGTGGGGILHYLRDSGFTQLHGFDYVPGLIKVAKQRDVRDEIAFIVADAASLPYASDSFHQAVYLQQLLCMIEEADKRELAVREVARVLKPGGTVLFSFLCYEARAHQRLYKIFLTHLWFMRRFLHRGVSLQLQPWLKHGSKLNLLALLDRPPFVYWFKITEAVELLHQHGFTVIGAASEKEANAGKTVDYRKLCDGDVEGMLYLVAQKNGKGKAPS